MNETEKLPIELSADGKRNAHSHYCSRVGHSKNYAVCQSLIGRIRNDGELPTVYSDCESGIKNSACPALKMQREEKEKGQAIYFVERVRSEAVYADPDSFVPHKVSNYKPKRGGKHVTPAAAAPAKPLTVEDQFLSGGGSYAAAINEAMSEPVPDKMKAVEPKVEHREGESLLEMAQRMIKENQAKKEMAHEE